MTYHWDNTWSDTCVSSDPTDFPCLANGTNSAGNASWIAYEPPHQDRGDSSRARPCCPTGPVKSGGRCAPGRIGTAAGRRHIGGAGAAV